MAVSIERLGPTLAARVSGLDLTRPLDPEQVSAIEAGMDEHAVLVFPAQRITDEQQVAFTLNFGALEETAGGNVIPKDQRRLDPQMADVSCAVEAF